MSSGGVKLLREQGRFQEALALAETDLSRGGGMWECRSMFWVLRDLFNQAIESNERDRAAEVCRRMAEILPGCNEDDGGVAVKALTAARRRLLPHHDEVATAAELSKGEATVERAYQIVSQVMDAGDTGAELHRSMGWVIFRYMKHYLSSIPAVESRRALARYMKLTGVERPSLLHSMMLLMAVNLEKAHHDEFKFTTFMEMWGPENFRPEDWHRERGDDGATFPSLVEKAVDRYLAEVKNDNMGTLSSDFENLLARVANVFTDNERYKRRLAIQYYETGRQQEAIEIYRKLPLTLKQYYVWYELGKMTGDIELEISGLCKSILVQRDRIFLVGIRLRLAELLIDKQDFGRALHELNEYHDTLTAHGYHIKAAYYRLSDCIPGGCEAASDNSQYYREQAVAIEQYVYGSLEEIPMVVVSRFEADNHKIGLKLVSLDGMITAKYKMPRGRPDVTLLYARVMRRDGKYKVVTTRDADERFPTLTTVEGILNMLTNKWGKPFAFIDGYYIDTSLLSAAGQGDRVRISGITMGGRKKAISLQVIR